MTPPLLTLTYGGVLTWRGPSLLCLPCCPNESHFMQRGFHSIALRGSSTGIEVSKSLPETFQGWGFGSEGWVHSFGIKIFVSTSPDSHRGRAPNFSWVGTSSSIPLLRFGLDPLFTKKNIAFMKFILADLRYFWGFFKALFSEEVKFSKSAHRSKF